MISVISAHIDTRLKDAQAQGQKQYEDLSVALLPYITGLATGDVELMQEYELNHMTCAADFGRAGKAHCFTITPTPKEVDVCPHCHECQLVFCTESCDLTCNNCGVTEYVPDLYTSTTGCYYDELEHGQTKARHQYSRVANFKAIVRNLEGTPVPINDVKLGEFIECFRDKLDSISLGALRKLMKVHKVNRHYNKIHYIMCLVNPKYKPLRLGRPVLNLITQKFLGVLDVFERLSVSQRQRHNFVSYNFALHQICNDLHLDFVLDHLRIIQGRQTLEKQQRVWSLLINGIQTPMRPPSRHFAL